MIVLDKHDQDLVDNAVKTIMRAVEAAHQPTAVAKKLVVATVGHRNKGRRAAIKNHPFMGRCEASGLVLDPRDAVLDELDPTKGYAGPVRWICPKANNSGRRSCGGC